MSDIRTEVATLAELSLVASLFDAYRQFYQQPPDLPLATSFIRSRMENAESVILLAYNEHHQAIGFCQLYPSFCSVEAASTYTLYDVFVVPESRRSGAGKALLLAAEQLAAAAGMARMDLSTAKDNYPAQSVYETLGWVRDDAFHTYSRRIKI